MLHKFAALLAVGGLAILIAEPAHAATRVQKSFGNWQVTCNEPEGKAKECNLQFSLVNKKAKQVVFSWALVRKDKDAATNKAIIRTPNGVLLADGVSIGFEGSEPVKVPYFTCGPRSCIAEFDFTDQWLKALSSKPKLTVNYKGANGSPLKHDVGLEKFTEAYDFFQSQMTASQQ